MKTQNETFTYRKFWWVFTASTLMNHVCSIQVTRNIYKMNIIDKRHNFRIQRHWFYLHRKKYISLRAPSKVYFSNVILSKFMIHNLRIQYEYSSEILDKFSEAFCLPTEFFFWLYLWKCFHLKFCLNSPIFRLIFFLIYFSLKKYIDIEVRNYSVAGFYVYKYPLKISSLYIEWFFSI